jgi:hypothetical protein
MNNHLTAEQIIEEALEVSMQEYPKTLLDKLFHRAPSETKLESLSIRYLTERMMDAENAKENAERGQYEIFKDALRIIGMYDPKEEMKFYQKHLQQTKF